MLPVAIALALIAAAIYFRPEPDCACCSRLGFHVSCIGGNMDPVVLPPLSIPDNKKVQLTVNPEARVDAGGVAVAATDYVWSTSDPSIASLEAGDDEWSTWVRTPLPGVATVTLTHTPSGATATCEVTVTTTAPGTIGFSVGTQVDE